MIDHIHLIVIPNEAGRLASAIGRKPVLYPYDKI
jgi:hypothetical protein